MKRLAFAAVAAAIGLAPNAVAQGVGATYGAYNSNALSLAPGALAPLQLDQTGNVKIDCIIGCGGAQGQGIAANPSGAWPFYPVQGGSAVSSANPLFIQDPFDGSPITGAAMPSGGNGILGWLSAMYRLQAGTLSVGGTVSVANNVAVTDSTVAYGATGAPTVTAAAINANTIVLAPEPGNVYRLHLVVLNLAAAGGANLYCTDDNSTPTPTSASFIVYAQGFYERDTPAWVPSAAINCVPAAGTVNYRAESYP